MSLLALRDAVVTELKAKLTTVNDKAIEPHGGRFTAQELARFATAAPAVRVAVLGVVRAVQEHGGDYELDVQLAVFLLTRSKAGVPEEAAALTLADAVLQIVPGNQWGLSYAQRPDGVRARNLYGADLDKRGTALWAVDWRQKICVGGLDPATLDDLVTYHVEYDVGETDDTVPFEDTVTDLDQ